MASALGVASHCDLINTITEVIGADEPAIKMEIRVQGYTSTFMLLDGGFMNVQRKLRCVFGDCAAADIKVQTCTHMTVSGLERPVFMLVLYGLPGDWKSVQLLVQLKLTRVTH